ncbi:MAG: OmpA family protein [Saprospiraceae bacterium]|nr:OmpA family protein [Saprospiraceae bacterium]
MRNIVCSIFSLIVLFTVGGMAQGEAIELVNPSFEGIPNHSSSPRGWTDCGFPGETEPDVHSGDTLGQTHFNVRHVAHDGNTYLGMVARDNDTWEKISQRLTVPLEADKCYDFSIYLARAEMYVSFSKTANQEVNYTTPIKLMIWGGASYCDKAELLAETNLVKNTRWLRFDLHFEPSQNHRYITLEAFYRTPSLFPYNGNILMDDMSPIIPVPCDEENPIAMVVEDPVPAPVPNNPNVDTAETNDPNSGSSTAEVNSNPEEGIMSDRLVRENLREGSVIQIDQLYFEADSSAIKAESYNVLDEIYRFLNTNKDVVVEIGGHTNGNPPHEYCDRLSTARAKAVADYLASKGISSDRLQFKGYGKRSPIRSNDTADGRKRNQRVEIKILSFDG